jgi:ABC-type multidrug transport system ATPase subunit
MTRRSAHHALSLTRVSASAGAVCLLDGVTFTADEGSLTVIAGPTGAGKTSLLRVVTGMLAVTHGAIRVGGRSVTGLEAADRGIGYVPQHDVLHETLTVRAALDYTAALRLPAGAGVDRRSRVREVIRELRLHNLAHQQIRTLSAGQRKRVAIACELLTRPTVIVLDEPTSSLDPGYEQSVMGTLRELADRGHCVLVVTHSAGAIAAGDRVVYLASGGRVAYVGTPEGAARHFATAGVPELFTMLDGTELPRWAEPRHDGGDGDRESAVTGPRRVRVLRQLGVLAGRYAAEIRSDRRHTAMLALQGLFMGGLLWLFVSPEGLRPAHYAGTASAPPSATGVAVLLALCMTWLGSANAVREIVKERGIVERERRAGLSIPAYVGSKLAVLGVVIIADAVLVAALGTARQGLPRHGAVLGSGRLELIIAIAMAGLCAVSLGLLVSAAVRSAEKAMAALPVVVVTEFVCSGLRPRVSWLPGLAQLRDLAGANWAVKAVQATVAGDAGAWWSAVTAMVGLSVAATTAATLLVSRAHRHQPQRRRVISLVAAAHRQLRHDESLRLVGVGLRSLAAVAAIVIGFHVVAASSPGRHHGGLGVAAAARHSTSPPAQFDEDLTTTSGVNAILDVGSTLPGAAGQTWLGLRTGVLLLEAGAQAVAR